MTDELANALAGEHAAIYGYGVVGAHLKPPAQDQARQAEAVHRTRRDALVVQLSGAGATAPPASATYELPFEVVDDDTAVRLAIHLEERTAAMWQRALGATTGDQRRVALDALVDCALRATRWRQIAATQPLTVALPGKI